MELEFRKVTLRDYMFLNLEFDEVDFEATDHVKKVCNKPIHDDLKAVIKSFDRHCVLINELVDMKKVKGDIGQWDDSILENITVKSITLNDEAAAISFDRKLSTGKVIPQSTPSTKFFDDAATKYKYQSELQELVQKLIDEVEEYLAGTKLGVVQMEMFTEGGAPTVGADGKISGLGGEESPY